MAKKPQLAFETRPWRDPKAKPFVRIKNVTKKFGDVTAVNDVFVLDAWSKAAGAENIEFISDGNGDFAKALGLAMDGSGFGLGTRSQRYAMLVEDEVVTVLNVEDAPSKAQVSGAENLLKSL